MKRVAVVGMGKMGIVHASILNSMPDVELVAVADRSKGLRRYLHGLGIKAPFYESLEEMIKAQKPDAIFACVPSSANYIIAKTCIENDVNIFVEKPLANNLENAEKMIGLVNGENLKHSVGFMVAYMPIFGRAKEIIDGAILGQIKGIEASAYLSAVFSPQKSWFYRRDTAGGGAVVSLGSHLIFLLNWFFGTVKQVKTELVYSSGNEVEDGGKVEMELEGGIEARMDVSWSTLGYETMGMEMVVYGSQGKLRASNQEINLWLDRGEHRRIHISEIPDQARFYLGGEGYYKEDEEFISSIGTDEQPMVTWREGYQVQKVLRAIYQAAETGGVARVEP